MLGALNRIIVVRIDRQSGAEPPARACVSANGSAWNAYAVVTGTASDMFDGTRFMIDPAGWLRAAHAARDKPDWTDASVLNNVARAFQDQPIASAIGGIHVHGP